MRRGVATAVLTVLLSACSHSGPGPASEPTLTPAQPSIASHVAAPTPVRTAPGASHKVGTPASVQTAAEHSAPAERPTSSPAFAPAPDINVPAGFVAQVFAGGLEKPTAMAYGPDGRLYVSEQAGRVVIVQAGGQPQVWTSGLTSPLGLAWLDGSLYVSEQGLVERVDGRSRQRHQILSGLPFREHQQDNLAAGPDGRLYLGSGSTCDRCNEPDPRSAAVLSFKPDGADLQIVAGGLRNPYGLAFQPGTGRLYASVNGEDDLGMPGDPEPADTLVVVQPGAWYGWPRCWADARQLRLAGDCGGASAPAAYLAPHASADGLVFYTGSSFPAPYRGNIFIAEWGQYLTDTGAGRQLVRVILSPNGTAPFSAVSVFASGFGHPLATVVAPDGALLVADWQRGVIYRIQAT